MTTDIASPPYETLTGDGYDEILEQYNPLLVVLPTLRNRVRPGAIWADPAKGRGDYHPCTAEYFLNQVVQYEVDERAGKCCGTRGIQAIRDKISANPYQATHAWETDVPWIPRRFFGFFSASQAWREYTLMADQTALHDGSPNSRFDPEAAKCVTYARVIATPTRMLLQYFYVYIYNDSANKHEGDWEMCAIELDRAKMTPKRMAFSGHQSGLKRVWEGITRRGDRPVVFVARGSHASYPEHVPGGIHVAEANWNKNLPGLLKEAVGKIQKIVSNMFFFCGIRDFMGVLTYAGQDDPLGTTDPKVVPLPATPPIPGDPDWENFWWMHIDCPWGSYRGGITEFVAPSPAWMQDPKWTNPFHWIDHLPAL